MDIQPGLHVVLSETNGANVTRHVHSLRGVHAHKDASNNWEWPLQDGLGSVREVVDNTVAVLESRNYDPFGTGFGNTGTSQTNYGFTGEVVDGGGLLDLRARRYAPGLGVFASLDPFEGVRDRAMSLNGYSWVEGNVPNDLDPSGNCPANPVTILDYRCWDLARGLAARFKAPVENFSWMDYGQLESVTFQVNLYGVLGNAAILPSLAAREEPQLVIQSMQQLLEQITCQSSNRQVRLSDVGGLVLLPKLIDLAIKYPKAVLPIGAIGIGIGFGAECVYSKSNQYSGKAKR